MKIYVIMKGDDENYDICAVTEDKERAEKLKNVFNEEYNEADIVEYDTEKFLPIIEGGYKIFRCVLYGRNNLFFISNETKHAEQFMEYAMQKLFWYDRVSKIYYGYVFAKNEEQAKEIFYQKLEEYKEKNKNAI